MDTYTITFKNQLFINQHELLFMNQYELTECNMNNSLYDF